MRWIVQEMAPNNSNVPRMIRALNLAGMEYLLVRIEKDGNLTLLSSEDGFPDKNGVQILDDFTKGESIVVYGSKKLAEIATKQNWKPGSFSNEKFEYTYAEKILGNEMLNADCIVGELWELNSVQDTFFMRPVGNNKLFNGGVFAKETLEEMKKSEKKGKSKYDGHQIMLGPLKQIKAEYRFFVVSGEIITGSSYRKNNELHISTETTQELRDYTENIIKKFALADAYVVDIADTTTGFKVIEYNNFNTSGLYACNEYKIVEAIEKMKPKEK